MHIGDGHQLLHAVAGELMLVLLDGIEADGINIFYGLGQSVGSYVIWGASLELEWQTLKGGLLPSHLVNHLAAALIWGQLLEPLFLTVEHANASRAVHLMSAESKKVAIYRLYVNLEVGGALGAVYQYRDAVGVSYLDNLLNRINRTQHIADMGYADNLGTRGNERFQLVETEDAVVGDGDVFYNNPPFHRLKLPRNNV